MLELVGATKRYRDGARGEIFAAREVTFTIAPGEIVALRGASGAGKSTILGLAAGVILPTEGEVRVRGEAFSRLREAFRARVRRESMGVVIQGLALVPRMSALENVLLAGVPDGSVDEAAIARAQRAMGRLGIDSLSGSHIESLSGGERQRVALARAISSAPELLLLDEPTAHLDAVQVDALVAILTEHRDRNGAALVATHDPRFLESAVVTRTLDVRDGRVML